MSLQLSQLAAATTSHVSAASGNIQVPSIAYYALSPILVMFGVALAGVLVDAMLPQRTRSVVQPVLALCGFIAALGLVISLHGRHETVVAGAVAVDGPALFLSGTILAIGIGTVLLFAEWRSDPGGSAFVPDAYQVPGTRLSGAVRSEQTEAYPLMVFSAAGMMVFASANNLLVMFVALEILSLPLYLLAGLARRRRLLSQEAALKYFLLGAFSSAFFLYGLAMLYGYAGTVSLGGIADATTVVTNNDTYLYIGLALLGVGLFFKAGLAPFHFWTPDVYEGAPTPVTAFMAAATKVAAFGALLRVLYVAFGPAHWDWRPIIWGVAILTMIVGAVITITQRDVKRLLAYSAIAHAGFVLVGVAAATRDGLSGSMFYLVTYGFTTIATFGIVTLVRTGDSEATDLSHWQGLGKRAPLLAGVFSFLLFGLAGIPLTSGFTGKFAVFAAALGGHALALVIIGVVASAVAAFYYLKIVVLMFFQEPRADGPVVVTGSVLTYAAVGLGTAVTLVLGVAPQPLLDLAQTAAHLGFVR